MKLVKMTLFLVTLLLISCANYDYVASFTVSGRIIDQATRLPVKDTRVDFVDTGFDFVRSKEHFAKNVGTTDKEGRLYAKFDYSWGNQGILWMKPSSKQTFDISVERTGYHKKVLSFKAKELEEQPGGWKVNLGVIELASEK